MSADDGTRALSVRRGSNKWYGSLSAHAVLIIIAAMMTLPFFWMVLASFKPLSEVENINPIPTVWRTGTFGDAWQQIADNYTQVFKQIPFHRYYFNSVFVAAWVTFLQCMTCCLAAFAFSRLQWRGRDTVFKLYLATMMIPGTVVMIPNFALMVKLHMLDSYLGLIVPASFGAFGTFLMRQFMLTIAPSIDEAATIDGASRWRLFWDIILPLARPGLITLAIFTFLGNYGSFFWPLVMIKSEHLRTLPIGMLNFDGIYGRQTNLIMAASVMNIVPLIILFMVSQKYLVKGIQVGGVKG
jgi:multiple sugar transport system permease protein